MVKKDQTKYTAASIEIELLRICHTATDIKNLVREMITIFKRYTGCEAVGLRLHRGDDFPYFEVRGFADEFVEAERYLCAFNADGDLLVDSSGNPVLECMCGNVIRGRFDPSKPFFTKHGSFWTNSTTKLLATTSEADRQARTRNRCNGEGYESVALIPVKAHGRTLGLIQFNDHKADMFTLQQIETLERLVDYSALAISDLEAVHALHESEKQYRRFVESSTEGVWSIDANHFITFANIQMAGMLGYSVEELIGKPIRAFLYPEDLPHHDLLMAERKNGNDEHYERRFQRKDGSTLWTIVSPKPIFDENGVFIGSFAMFTDISARKRMEEVQDTRLHLIRYAEHHSLDELLQEGLDSIEELTGSQIGFCHFLEDNQNTLSLESWSSQTSSTYCKAEGKGTHYSVDQAGVWVDCIHQRRPVIHNDLASLPHRKGMPEGHAWVDRELVVPVFRGDKITSIFGVGNKPRDYTQEDVSIVSLFADMVWDIAEKKIADIKLKESEDKYKSLLESSPNGVFVVQDGVYKYANQHGMQMLHCSAEQVNGLSAMELVHPDDREAIVERISNAQSGSANELTRVRIIRPDGTILYSESSSVPVDYNGKPAILIVSRDVSSQIELEKLLGDIRLQQKVMLDNIKLGIVLVAEDGSIIRGNNEFFNMLGYSYADLPGISVTSITAPESREQTCAAIQRLISGQDPVMAMEKMYLRKDGSCFFATTNATVVRDGEGNVQYLTAFIQDITEQKQAEKQIMESESRFRSFVESANDIVYSLSPDGKFTYISPNWKDLLGYEPEATIGTSFEEYVHPEDRHQCWDFLQGIVDTGQKNSGVEYRLKHKNGDWRWHTSNGSPLFDSSGRVTAFLGISRDTTERRQAEEAHELERNLLQQSQEMANLGSFVWDLRDDSLTWSRNMFVIHGLDPEAFKGNLNDVSQHLIHPEDLPRVQAEIQKMLAARQVWAMQFRIVRQDHRIRIIQSSGEFEYDTCGNPVRCIGIHQDITDRKEAEEKLMASETLLAKSQEIALVGSWELEIKSGRLAWSDEVYRIVGLVPQEMDLSYDAFLDMIHPDDRKMVDEAYSRSVQDGLDSYEIEHRLVQKHTGDIRTVFEKCIHIRDGSGKVVKSVGMVQDITERKLAERTLAREKQRLENIILGTNSGTWELNLQTSGVVINERWAQMLGYTVDELAPTNYETWTHLVHPDDLQKAQEAENNHFEGISEFYEAEIRMRHKHGHWVWVLTRGKLIARTESGKPYLMYGTHQDITERKTADQKIRESSEQFHTLISTSLDGFFINDKTGAILEANPAYCNMLGYSRDELLQMRVSEIDVLETQEMVDAHIRAIMENGSDRFEAKHQCKDGHIIDVDIISTYVPSRDVFLVFIRDITDQIMAQEGLKESEARFRNMADTAPVLVWMAGEDKLCTYFNQPWLTFTGRTLEEETGNGWKESVHPDDLDRVVNIYTTTFDSRDEYTMEYRILSADGSYHWILDKGVPRYTPDGTFVGYIGSAFDINERKLAESELMKQERILEETQKIARIGSFELDFVNNTRYWSKETFRILAADENQPPPPIGGILDLIHPDDKQVAYTALQECRQTGKKIDLSYRIITGNGKLRYIHELGAPLFDKDGNVVKITGSIQDITERKLAEAEFNKHEQLLEESQKTAQVGSYIIDLETGINFWTRETYHIFGLDETQPVPSVQDYQQLVYPDDIPLLYEDFQKTVSFGEKFDQIYRIKNKAGQIRYVHSIGNPEQDPLGKVIRIVGTFQDVTYMKASEQELLLKQNILEESQRIALLGSFVIDLEHKTRSWSRETYRILGMDENGPAPQMGGFEDMIHPDDAKMEEETFRDCIQTGRPMDLIYRIITIDGETRFVHELGRPEFDPEGNVIRIVGTLQDVTESRKLENKLKESELRFRSIFENIPIGYQSLNPDGCFLDVNPAWSTILGYNREEVLGKWFGDFLVPEEVNLFRERFPMFKNNGKINNVEFHFRHKDGHVLVGNFNGMIEHDAFGGVVRTHCNLEDITIRKQTENSLHASLVEKDVLIREVHHRVKNNLAAILGLLEMERQTTSDVHADSLLLDLSNRIKSMATVHEKLYRAENLSRIDFQDYLKSFVSHLKTTFREKENIISRIEADGIELNLDLAVPCGLIVNELVTNSLKYAFPEGKPGSRKDKQCQIVVKMIREGNSYILQVSDNGVGLPEEFNWQDAKSMGLRLVRMLGEHQLGGKIETDTTGGTAYTIRFEARLKEQDYV